MQQIIVVIIGILVFGYAIYKIGRSYRKSRRGDISCSTCAGCELKQQMKNKKSSCCGTSKPKKAKKCPKKNG